jgi:hypothetical protein
MAKGKKKDSPVEETATPVEIPADIDPSQENDTTFEIDSIQESGVADPITPANSQTFNEVPVIERATLTVDAELFYRLFKMCVHGYGQQLNKNVAVSKFGAALGAKTPQECKARWDEANKFLSGK